MEAHEPQVMPVMVNVTVASLAGVGAANDDAATSPASASPAVRTNNLRRISITLRRAVYQFSCNLAHEPALISLVSKASASITVRDNKCTWRRHTIDNTKPMTISATHSPIQRPAAPQLHLKQRK